MKQEEDKRREGAVAHPYAPPDSRTALVRSMTRDDAVKLAASIDADILDDSDLLDRILLLVT